PKRVLYATGFSAQSLYAGKFALAIAERNQAQLAMLHVVNEAPDDMAQREGLQHENEERLRQLVPLAASLPRAPELRVAFGPAAEAILSTAEVWKPDVIVLGLRRHSQEAQQRTWATAYSVVSSAPCPVLTVRTPEDL
ncbi:MAG: universal stress protein, partial [Terriglobales bacterium]